MGVYAVKIEFKKVIAATLSLLFIAASFVISSKGYEMRLANANAINNRVIIIDAGHGGFDGGAQAAIQRRDQPLQQRRGRKALAGQQVEEA